MSQKTSFYCDQCKKEIGKNVHITLVLNTSNSGTGIALPPTGVRGWITTQLPQNFIHFHNGKCIGAYFDNLIRKATPKKS